MLLDRLSVKGDPFLGGAARALERAVAETIGDGIATADLGGSASTSEFTAAVVDRITAA